ncbi:hypothetical protein K7X08_031276 [Anisodus acutangulus]|uniref:Uncharacterized protein n=1 Tax=Anisodus acutangulus TaxID=402998 RepID=A0A9Q1MM15_9SOLA|nr:hypothetical protein K7X08_031276 [Anisodus acutangulus]
MPHGSSVTCIVSPDEEYQHQLQQHHHHHHQQQLLVFGQARDIPTAMVDYTNFSHFSISNVNNSSNDSGGDGEFALQQYYNTNYDVHLEDKYRYDSNNKTSMELPPLTEDTTSSGNCYYFSDQSSEFPTTAIPHQMGYSSSSNSLLDEIITPMEGGSIITTTNSTTTTAGNFNYFGFDDSLQPLQCSSSNMQDESNNNSLGYFNYSH